MVYIENHPEIVRKNLGITWYWKFDVFLLRHEKDNWPKKKLGLSYIPDEGYNWAFKTRRMSC